MSKKKHYLALAVIIGVACSTPEGAKEQEKTAYDVDFRSVLEPYCLLHKEIDTLSLTDVNTVLFLKEGRWDTSFFLVLCKDTASIKGTYQETTPSNEEVAYKTGVVLRHGFSFNIYDDLQNKIYIDSIWNAITSETKPLLDTVYNKWDLSCCDRSRFLLSHRDRFTVNHSSKNEDDLEKYAQFLRKTVVHPIYNKWKRLNKNSTP
jgi:hypothetical protein